MATIDEIKQQAEAVKNASHVGENTALRVGGVLVDLCECMKNLSGGGTSGGSGGSSSTLYPFTIYNGSSDNDYITYDGSSAAYLKFKSGFSISKVGLGYEISATGGSGSGVTLNPTMDAMNKQLGKTKLNTPQFLYWDGITYTWKNESEISGGGGSSSRIKKIKLFNSLGQSFETIELGTADTIGFMAGDNVTLQPVVKEYTNVVKISASGSGGSSGTTSGKLRFYQDSSEESWNGESDFKIIFGSGLNVTWDSHSQITLSATGGSSGGSSGGSVSWTDVTNKPSTFKPSSHTHLTNDINGLDSYVKGTKVSNANAADRLANAVTLWGNSFSGNNSIGTASSRADLKYVKDIYAGDTFDIKAGNNSLLKVDGTPNIYVGFGYMANNKASLLLFGNKTTIYTSGDDYRYDFKGGVFDVNTNTIHFGPEAGGGKISWDRANNAFKIEGNLYSTGGITALGVSNSATTSNNLDFTFKSVTAKKNTIYASDNYPFQIYPEDNDESPLKIEYTSDNSWNIVDDNGGDIRLQDHCSIDSDGWVYSPQFRSIEQGDMLLNGHEFSLGSQEVSVSVIFYHSGNPYKLDMSKAISLGVFTAM